MEDIAKYTDFLFYHSEDGTIKVQVIADAGSETIWTTQKGMSEIFGVEVPAISKHLKNIFETGELNENSVVSKMEITASDSKKYKTSVYNLDVIIAVGYRINSLRATAFRIWATKVLREYLIKGFTLDDERLKKGGRLFDRNYFDELLERIREIRSSERMFYQKLTDLFAHSVDYDRNSPVTRDFYASIQNKLEFAVVGKTAAEIIVSRADHHKEYMGLKTWKDARRGGKIQLSDTKVAKNYMTYEELDELNKLVNFCLDGAEIATTRGRVITMQGWIEQINSILSLYGYELLKGAGTRSREEAETHATTEYEAYRPIQDAGFLSDFDRFLKKLSEKEN